MYVIGEKLIIRHSNQSLSVLGIVINIINSGYWVYVATQDQNQPLYSPIQPDFSVLILAK